MESATSTSLKNNDDMIKTEEELIFNPYNECYNFNINGNLDNILFQLKNHRI